MMTILLIEDNCEIRENFAEILELEKYQVYKAENGITGISHARIYQPDLIICDIVMPGMDGYEVISQLKNDPSTQYIPFIFLTCKSEKNDLDQAIKMGAMDCLVKPVDEHTLMNAIRTVAR